MNKSFFLNPTDPMQKRYEALRSAFVDNLTDAQAANKYGYTLYSFKSLKRDAKNFSASNFFCKLNKGPKGQQNKTLTAKDRMIELRKRNFSVPEICEKLKNEGILLSSTTISSILHKEGFTKLFRRTNRERLEALQSDKKYPEYSNIEEFGLKKEVTTYFGGIFLFLPIIMELKLNELFLNNTFYGSKMIPNISYLLSYLALKLLGKDRISHIDDFGFDYGLGIFAGLNVLPKSASISKYSYRHSKDLIRKMLTGFIKRLHTNGYIKGKNINLDFHSIPFYGDESVLEKHWVPMRNKRMTSVLSFFAQDLDSTYLCFSDGEIKKDEVNDEILEFLKFYENSTGILPERLIFDSKLTTYNNLSKLNEMKILFITLKRRGKNFKTIIEKINNWQKVKLDNVKRKYRNLEYVDRITKLTDYDGDVRWIIVKGTGRELPMSLVTNDFESSVKTILTLYSHRWRIENNIQENIDFFNLNALSSPVVVKVDFDIAFTLIANTLYKILAEKTKWFKDSKPKKISRNFIDIKSDIKIEKEKIKIRLSEKNYNPMIMNWVESLPTMKIPWWENREIEFSFN